MDFQFQEFLDDGDMEEFDVSDEEMLSENPISDTDYEEEEEESENENEHDPDLSFDIETEPSKKSPNEVKAKHAAIDLVSDNSDNEIAEGEVHDEVKKTESAQANHEKEEEKENNDDNETDGDSDDYGEIFF